MPLSSSDSGGHSGSDLNRTDSDFDSGKEGTVKTGIEIENGEVTSEVTLALMVGKKRQEE